MKPCIDGLNPIVRDRAGPVEPLPAALAAITAQPLSEIERILCACRSELAGIAGIGRKVANEDAIYASLQRLGYQLSRLFVDCRCRPVMGQLINVYKSSDCSSDPMIALCECGHAFAFRANEVSAWTMSRPSSVDRLVRTGSLDLDQPVQFAMSVSLCHPVPIVAPDRGFLAALAASAHALAAAYSISIEAVGWPYWRITFPNDLTDGAPGSSELLVCGEHDLLSLIDDRVRLYELTGCAVVDVLKRLRT